GEGTRISTGGNTSQPRLTRAPKSSSATSSVDTSSKVFTFRRVSRSEVRGPRFDRLRFQLCQCGLSVPRLAGLDVVLSGAASEILQDVCLQRWRGERAMIVGDVAGQLTVGSIWQLESRGGGDGGGR